MGVIDRIVTVSAKLVSAISARFGFGAGGTWPGEIALRLRPSIARTLTSSIPDGVILVAGTNGKTTTSLMISTILEHIGDSVILNATGANLLNGIVSACIRNADWLGRITADIAIFEVDENSLPVVLRYMTPKRIVLLNLFRDQLDRYGEVDVIVSKWRHSFERLSKSTEIIANGDDPGVAYLGQGIRSRVRYFGISDPRWYRAGREYAADSAFCPSCGTRLSYDGIYYSHIGVWSCSGCGLRRPDPDGAHAVSPLPGIYNLYNTLAAVTLAKSLDIPDRDCAAALADFRPAFGRQEEVVYAGKPVRIFLSKNPAGFNASLRTVLDMGAKDILFLLNDRIPDGRDVSWIWDVDFETIPRSARVWVSGDRVYDLAIRMKYAEVRIPNDRVLPSLREAIDRACSSSKGTLYVLATYSAMLEARKIIGGRKIL